MPAFAQEPAKPSAAPAGPAPESRTPQPGATPASAPATLARCACAPGTTCSCRGELPLDATLRAAVAARNPRGIEEGLTTRNPEPDDAAVDDEELVTRSCGVASGPTYTPSGNIPVTNSGSRKSAPFTMAATFSSQTSSWWEFWRSDLSPACCEVRQYIKWDKAFQDYNGGPPHSGFPSGSSHGIWYEDRDTSDKRYGHRSGPHSDPIGGGGDEYTTGGVQDQANGDTYAARDTPAGPTSLTGQYKFKLEVIDTCDASHVKARSPDITIDW